MTGLGNPGKGLAVKLNNEEDVLNIDWRKAYISHINSEYNNERKRKAYKRFEIYRDNTKKWVIEALKAEDLKESTLKKLEKQVSNISICKKVIEKKAMIYQAPPARDVKSEDDKAKIQKYSKELDFDSSMAKVNRYLELSRNTLTLVIPQKNVIETLFSTNGKKIYDLSKKVLNDHSYDVIVDSENCEVARGFVLSDYVERKEVTIHPKYTGRRPRNFKDPKQDQLNGTTKLSREYIFWTNLYHFTCDEDGEIIKDKSPDGFLNPIRMLPAVDFSYDKDGKFWAEGGDDLIDASIGINVKFTHMDEILKMQGYGQLTIVGPNIPDVIEVGPHSVLRYQTNAGEDKPDINFLSTDPQTQNWLNSIEAQVSFTLSTNNLSPRNVSTKLDVVNPPSGISQLIENSEVTFDIEDKQKIFKDKEPLIWEVVRRWSEELVRTQQLSKRFLEIGLFADSNVQLTFSKNKAVVTEGEKLDNLKKRKDLGIATDLDLIMLDNPDLTEEQAQKKLDEINAEKQAKMSVMVDVTEDAPTDDAEDEVKVPNTEEKGKDFGKDTESKV